LDDTHGSHWQAETKHESRSSQYIEWGTKYQIKN
jgi:hypothetical protein